MYKLHELADVLRAAGLNVKEYPGWQTRGHGDMKGVRGILCHHTAEAVDANVDPVSALLLKGRPDLPGPLSQLGLGQDGKWHVIAAGKSYHAGKGAWAPMQLQDNGNSWLIGVEAENNGLKEVWPPVQLDAYWRGCAAMAKHYGLGVSAVIGHKEYAPGRKTDPNFDMDDFRQHVADHMS